MYQKPKMILFDYGQTLITEEKFDPVKGNKALLKHTKSNPNGAYNAGMKPVWYTACMDGDAGMLPVVPHLKIDDWEELIHML